MSQTLTTLQVVKRDGRVVPFDRSRIERAIERCEIETHPEIQNWVLRENVAAVITHVDGRLPAMGQITVEEIQDLVEQEMMKAGLLDSAKAYILYRAEHARLRDERPIPEDVKVAFAADEVYFPTPLQQFVFYDKYSRFSQDLGRRETWVETVDRTVGALHKLAGDRLDREIYEEIRDGILTMRVMPSMRLLAMAGPAFDRDHTTGYNCAYSAVDSLETFSEALIISTSGCGVGFSVESKFINQLPSVVPQRDVPYPVHWIEDSAEGWADALLHGLEQWFSGEDIAFAYDMIRPRGAVLKTKGGRASGPDPLRQMLSFVREKVLSRQGKKLRPIDCHDMLCSIGNAAVSGGQRRTAMISLFDEDDHDMLTSKAAGFEVLNKQRWNANNSAVWENVATMDQAVFIERFLAMVKSGNGEPGIFSRESASILMPSRRDSSYEFGGNPCLEIFLRSREFCNLSASVVRADDTIESLEQKVRLATIIGTIQSMATNFPHLRPEWKKNCEEERLLGVDITGQQDNPELLTSDNFLRLRAAAIETNRVFADKLGINRSASITCVKPSGNCRPWYGLTTTDQGILTLQEIFDEHPEGQAVGDVHRDLHALQDDEPRRIVKTHDNGISPTVRIRMNYGMTVESTPNHQWFVAAHKTGNNAAQSVNHWVQAKDIRLGDILEIRLGTYNKEQHSALSPLSSMAWRMRGEAHPITQPAEMNEDLAWFLGYLWGDGCMSAGGFRFRFSDARLDNLEKAKKIAFEQFGVIGAIYQMSQRRRAMSLEFSSIALWHWLIRNGVFKYFADRIDILPRCIRSSSRDDIIAFIAGLLDSDGWVGHNQNGAKLSWCTADTFFSQHLQDVAWSVGLGMGRSLNSLGENMQRKKNIYLMCLSMHVNPVAFAALVRNSNKARNLEQAEGFKGWEWQQAKRAPMIPGKVTALEDGDTVPTYDAEVEDNHWFYAGAVKSHNTSQLVDCASGLHARWAPYYVRNVRVSGSSPLARVLRDAGAPMSPENGDDPEDPRTWVVSFPVKAPAGASTRNDRTAVEQCEWWLRNRMYWTEHNPSTTTTYKPNEVLDVMKWVWDHRDKISGMSFLPSFDAKLEQLPYIEIDQTEYERRIAEFPKIDFSKIYRYELDDRSTASTTGACEGAVCLINE